MEYTAFTYGDGDYSIYSYEMEKTAWQMDSTEFTFERLGTQYLLMGDGGHVIYSWETE